MPNVNSLVHLDIITEQLDHLDQPQSLLETFLHIGSCLQNEELNESLQRKLKFLVYEAKVQLNKRQSPLQQMELLAQYFFREKSFKCLNESSHPSSGRFLLQNVLSSRSSSSLVLSVLIRSIAAGQNIECSIISLKQNYLLKFIGTDKSYFLAPCRTGQILCATELIELLNEFYDGESAPSMDCLESLSGKQLLNRYLEALRRAVQYEGKDDILLEILCLILKLEPGNMKVLGERGLLYHKKGAKKEALADLKRYFSFSEPEVRDCLLKNTYSRLQSELASNSKAFEILPSRHQ